MTLQKKLDTSNFSRYTAVVRCRKLLIQYLALSTKHLVLVDRLFSKFMLSYVSPLSGAKGEVPASLLALGLFPLVELLNG